MLYLAAGLFVFLLCLKSYAYRVSERKYKNWQDIFLFLFSLASAVSFVLSIYYLSYALDGLLFLLRAVGFDLNFLPSSTSLNFLYGLNASAIQLVKAWVIVLAFYMLIPLCFFVVSAESYFKIKNVSLVHYFIISIFHFCIKSTKMLVLMLYRFFRLVGRILDRELSQSRFS